MKLISRSTLKGLTAILACGVGQISLANDLSYKTLSFGYQEADVSLLGNVASFDGFMLEGRYEVAANTFFYAANSDFSSNDAQINADVTTFEFGLGGYSQLTRKTDLMFGVGYLNQDQVFLPFLDQSINGYTVFAGLRGYLTPVVELEASVRSAQLDGISDTTFNLIGRYNLGFIAPELRITQSDDTNIVGFGLQVRF